MTCTQDQSYEPYIDNVDNLENVDGRHNSLPHDHTTFIEHSHRITYLSDNSADETSSWDDEAHGDRLVYDASYELNSELTPWNLASQDETDEVFGFYV